MPPERRDRRSPRLRFWRFRHRSATIGAAVLGVMVLLCFATLPWTMSAPEGSTLPRYQAGEASLGRLPPPWWPAGWRAERLDDLAAQRLGQAEGTANLRPHWPNRAQPLRSLIGTDALGRSLLVRVLVGGTISLTVGIAAAAIAVVIGTLYGAISGYLGGRTDAFMMRIVDILYGLPYILLVVLIAVAADALVERWNAENVATRAQQREAWVQSERMELPPGGRTEEAIEALHAEAVRIYGTGEMSARTRSAIDVGTLLLAIGGVSWLTMARVIRGQVLSLKSQPFIESAKVSGASTLRIFRRHLLPNLVGPIVVYATLTVPQAILQESFLSFLGIGVRPPLPSWGNLAAEGIEELHTHGSDWWLLVFPCVLLAITLMSLNFMGEGLREALDPKRAERPA